jgi:hypothetical protein
MSIARAIARRLFGRSIEVLDLEIVFHKAANHFGSHGIITASHKDLGLANEPVRFVFIGMTTPPALTPRVLEYIWEEARAQGFLPTAVESYGHVLTTHVGLPPRALVSADRRNAECMLRPQRVDAFESTRHVIAAAAQPDNSPSVIDSLLIKQG